MKKVYISGPMTGHKDNNYPAFFEAEERLKKMGFDVINPARNTPPEPATWEAFMRMAIKQVCDADAVVMLDGWRKSIGATTEVSIADVINIPVIPINTLSAKGPAFIMDGGVRKEVIP